MSFPVLPEHWHWTLFLADDLWQLAVWNVPPHVDLREVAVFVHADLNLLALTLHPFARPVQDHASLVVRMPVPAALPGGRLRRQRFVPCTRAFLLTWPLNRHAGRPSALVPVQQQPQHLIIQCDGSGGGRWGVGVHIPSQRAARRFGGDASALPEFPGTEPIDSATVEAVAVVCALDVAARVLRERTHKGVLLVVDNTGLAWREMTSPRRVAAHHRAVLRHVYRRAEILLKRGFEVLVMHKKIFGLCHSWSPDGTARKGRDLEQPPFGDARATTTPITFVCGARGNFLGHVAPGGQMLASVLGTYRIEFAGPPRRPPPR